MPILVSLASPGPFTTQPIIDKEIVSLICDNFSSIIFTVLITSKFCLAQEGQDIIVTPLFLIPNDLRI